jgi:tellurite resistance protein TerC
MIWLWIGFIVLVLSAMALDLGVFHRKAHAVKAKEALGWTAFYVALSLLFAAVIYFLYGHHVAGLGLDPLHPLTGGQAALEYLSGYLIEESLSVDNIFVIALIMAHFCVPPEYQHRVLFWGVLGVLVMRGAMIGVGLALFSAFTWMAYVFGGLLLLTAAKMYWDRNAAEVHPDKNLLIRFFRRFYPVSSGYDGPHFMTRLADGRRALTPLFLVLVTVEITDLVFALDSIPAVFAVTTDPFLVFTSNVFAILGLRSLYFAVNDLMNRLHYMKLCLVVLLAFIGMKMVLTHHYPIHTGISLGIIAAILGVGVLASVVRKRRQDVLAASCAIEPGDGPPTAT